MFARVSSVRVTRVERKIRACAARESCSFVARESLFVCRATELLMCRA